jgi:hypothetical protein
MEITDPNRFVLFIAMGSDGMCAPEDVAGALVKVAGRLNLGHRNGPIHDRQSSLVGSWALNIPLQGKPPCEHEPDWNSLHPNGTDCPNVRCKECGIEGTVEVRDEQCAWP